MHRSARWALAASCAALLALLAACGGSSSPSSSNSGSGATGGSTGGSSGPSKNLSITAAVTVPATIDPDPVGATGANTPNIQFQGTLFSYMNVGTKQDVTLDDIRNDLAETATPSADGLTWSIKLRSGIKSSVGNPLTTADVKYTIDRAINNKANAYASLQRVNLDFSNPYTITDDLNFQIHLTAPSPLFKSIWGGQSLGILDQTLIQQSAGADDPWGLKWLNTHSASFGTYDVQSFTPSQTLVYVANPNYWQGLPDVTKATFTTFSDPTQKLQSVLSGTLDMAMSMATADKAQFTASSSAIDYGGYGAGAYYLLFDQTSPDMQNLDFRKAISAAIDRQALSTVAYHDQAKPITSCMPTAWGVPDTKVNKPTADVATAKKLMANVPTKTVSIGISSQAAEASDTERLMTSELAAAGITADFHEYSSATTMMADMASHKLDAWFTGHFPASPDAGFFWSAYFVSTSPQNTIAYKDPSFDANVAKIMSTTGDARTKLISDTCTQFDTDLPMTELFSIGTYTGLSKKLTNGQNYPDSAIRIYNLKAAS
jgi:peptide/nickel transport system substrate-binding protein